MKALDKTLAKISGFTVAIQRTLDAPLNRGRPLYGLGCVLRWQIKSRLARRGLVVPFVGQTRLLGRHGMTGMTLNVYCGLAEPGPMGFLLHLLRPGDLFVDAGANVGVYTVLASGVCGARSVACEPIDAAAADMQRNVDLNGIGEQVEIARCALGAAEGTGHMTSHLDTMNRVLEEETAMPAESVEVDLTTLDALLDGRVPCLVKVDVEGYEEHVLRGARETLAADGLVAVIIEMWSDSESDKRRGRRILREMSGLGFSPFVYEPIRRKLSPLRHVDGIAEAIFCRNAAALAPILDNAPRRKLHGTSI